MSHDLISDYVPRQAFKMPYLKVVIVIVYHHNIPYNNYNIPYSIRYTVYTIHTVYSIYYTIYITLYLGWPTQLHHWANILVPIVKRVAKLLITNSLYFSSFLSNFLVTFLEPHPLCICQKPIPPKFFRPLN